MKSYKFFLFMLVAFLSSCVDKDEWGMGPMHEVVFHAGWDKETRTVLQSDGQIFWSPNDSISLFPYYEENIGIDGGYKFISTNKTAAATTDFRGSVPETEHASFYYAVYPFDKRTSYFGGNKIDITIPTIQTAKENGLPENTFFSVAKSEGSNLYFKNICGGVQFTVASEGIKSVEFRAQSKYSCSLSESGWVQFDANGNPELTGNYGPNYVIVKAPDGGTFVPGEKYYAVMMPFDEQNGFVVTYRKASTEASYVYDSFTVKRSVFKKVEAMDDGLTFTDSYTKAILSWSAVPRPGNDITDIQFHVNSDKVTDDCVADGDDSSLPIYSEMEGSVCHLYTEAQKFEMDDTFSFQSLSSLKTVDLTNVSTQNHSNFVSMFGGCSNLTDVIWGDFNTESATDFNSMFTGCTSLKHLDLSGFSTSKVKSMANMFSGCTQLEDVNLSSFDTSNVEEMYSMFSNCEKLTSLDLSNFNTPKVRNMNHMFKECTSLSKLDISNFTSESLSGGSALLYLCPNLTQINMGNWDLSGIDIRYMCSQLANRSKNCGILCTPTTRELLLTNTTNLPKTAKYITWFTPGQVMPDFEPIIDPNLYISTDYSKDKQVKKLQSATTGNGIDIVLMGDAYSDRLIANGTYDQDMNAAMEAIFAREPYKTYRNLFNVYEIYAVSENEVPGETTVFGCYDFGNRDLRLSDDKAITDYVKTATSRTQLRDDVGIIVVSNDGSDNGWSSGSVALNGSEIVEGFNIAFVNSGDRGVRFGRTLSHEFGHSFAHLLDEYVEFLWVTVPEWEKESWTSFYNTVGFYSNVDFTSDPATVKWHRMLEDSRYAGSGIGVYEGGATYSNGVWRSTENSIMRDNINQDRFNAVCREAIYKRIHQLAYGNSWQYDYDTFVNYDLSNIQEDKAKMPSTRSVAAPKKSQKPVLRYEVKEGPNGVKTIKYVMN